MELFKPILLLLFIASISSAFELTKVEPKLATIPYGGKLRLTCNGDNYWEFCKFIHNDKICDLIWKRDPYNVTIEECTDYEGRMRYVGSYNNYECIIEIDNVSEEGKNKHFCCCI